jgi:hypothetical protein
MNPLSLSAAAAAAGENNAEGERARAPPALFSRTMRVCFGVARGADEVWVMKMNNRVRGGANAERCEFHALDD